MKLKKFLASGLTLSLAVSMISINTIFAQETGEISTPPPISTPAPVTTPVPAKPTESATSNKRNDMTASQLLAAAYKKADYTKNAKVSSSLVSTTKMAGFSMDMKTSSDMFIENASKMYMNTKMTVLGKEVTSEILVDKNTLYTKNATTKKWTASNQALTEDTFDSTIYGDSHATSIAADLTLFADYTTFKNDVTKNGKDYYVVNISLDETASEKAFGKIKNDLLAQLDEELPEDESEQSDMIKAMFKSLTMNLSYNYYINKQTLKLDSIEMKDNCKLNVPIDENPTEMNIAIEGTIHYSELDKGFMFPSVTTL